MNKRKKERVIIIGGRSKAKSLAISLLSQGYRVTVINSSYEDCIKLAELPSLTVINGDGTKPHILDEAGAGESDIVIALMSKDADNLVACQLCKSRFNVPKTVSLVADPNKMAFFYQMGVDSVVCAVSALTGIIQQQAFVDEMSNIIPVGEGRVQIVQPRISEQSPISGKKLWEITLPKQCIVGCILRGDSFLIPRGDTRILAGDVLVVITGNSQNIEQINALAGR